jgi:phage terminase large subunit GpA-like protein
MPTEPSSMRVDEIQILAADVLLPPPDLTVSQWADQNARLSSEFAAEKGEWRTDRAPYQRAVMDAMGPSSPYETVVMMWAAQSGKTSLLGHFLGYIIDLDPGPVLLVEPREVDAEAFSKDRLAPMLRDTPCLRGKVADARSRDSNNTILHKKFLGGSITLAAANSPAGLAMRSIRYCLLDEVDRYPASAGSEGDPVNLAITRTANFWNRKVVLCSTPTTKGASRIEQAWLNSNQQSFWSAVPALWRVSGARVGQPGLAQGCTGEGRVPLRALLEANRRLAEAPDAQGRRVARGAARGGRYRGFLDQWPLLAVAQVGRAGEEVPRRQEVH